MPAADHQPDRSTEAATAPRPGDDDPGGKGPAGSAETDSGHREEAIERSFDRILDEGKPRLARPWLDVLITGLVGGIEVAFGILALLYVEAQTGDGLLGGLAFSIGFIALRLGHSELFTEGFLVPVTVVAAGEGRLRDLAKLWIGTLAGNLAGGLLMAVIIDAAFPTLHHQAVEVGGYYVRAGIDVRTFCLAVLAGAGITLLTRMQLGTDEEVPKLVASVGIAFVLAGFRLFHSVLDSILAFTALLTDHATFGWAAWAGFLAWAVLGNVVGGLVLTTVLRLARSRERIFDHRAANDLAVPASAARERS